MGKLLFYSDQVVESTGNKRLDCFLFSGLDNKNMRIGYIPSTEDKGKVHFHKKTLYYQSYGIEDIMFFDLYDGFNSSKIKDLIECDIIHLAAGNPIEFSKALERRKLKKVLRDYVEEGGTIVGVSGGAVQLGKSITLFQLFIGDVEEELDGLHLVDFEFLPHYNRWTSDYKSKVQQYAKQTGTTVYAGNDGDGIVVENGEIEMVGNIVLINS